MEDPLKGLGDGELCVVMVYDKIYEAEWSAEHRCWFRSTGEEPRSILPTEVMTWARARKQPLE